MTNNITKQPVLNIGLVGHIDHGKTTLLYQLTGIWSDKHSEELKRGITIKLGYADVIIRKCGKCGKYAIKEKCEGVGCGGKTEEVKYISFVDAPGHEMLMATMLGGAAIIDAALLVIAGNEPFPQPQTKEHLLALESKGIKKIIIIQNKLDLVTKEQAIEQFKKIKEFIKGSIAEKAEIIPVCGQQGVNISAVFEAIDKLEVPERDVKSKPLFLIARSFDINKPGTKPEQLKGGILGGTLKKGRLAVGQEIEIKPGRTLKKHDKIEYETIKTKILALRSGKNDLDEALPSGSLAIQTSLDPLLTKADSLSGCIASIDETLPEITTKIKLKTNLFKEIVGAKEKEKIIVEKIKMNENLMLSVNTSISLGSVTSVRNGVVELFLKIPIVPFLGDRFGIARNYKGHWRLVGSGELA
jgi:translation initiation factor 2 subunit 3